MNILFLESDPMWIYGLPNGFRDLGHEVLVSGPIDQNIESVIKKFKPDFAVTFGWTYESANDDKRRWIQNSLKEHHVYHIYWDTEDPTHLENYTLGYLQKMQPDVVFSVSRVKVDRLLSLGYKAAYLPFGYHENIHCPGPMEPRYLSDVALVANGYPDVLQQYPQHYRHQALAILLTPLVKAGIRVNLYGRGWQETARMLGLDIPEDWFQGPLPYLRASRVYHSATIILGLQNHLDGFTLRTCEVLASGGFLLTCGIPALHELGEPGRDFLVSYSANETLALIQHYLHHPDERKVVVENAQKKVVAHRYQHRAEYIIETLQNFGILN